MSQTSKKRQTIIKKPNDFHVAFRPRTAEWLRQQINEDLPSVPAVVRAFIEEKERLISQPCGHCGKP